MWSMQMVKTTLATMVEATATVLTLLRELKVKMDLGVAEIKAIEAVEMAMSDEIDDETSVLVPSEA